ncbi:MAG: ATP-binding cassette domain-containing protein [Eubacterium sp.]|nr:ATP-binding cassette domain-containing protein [Eubacterium sp.]
MKEIIKVHNLTKDYGDGKGIFGFDFSVNSGEAYGIVGTNGSGKTTTLRHLMGFLKPDSGSCSIYDIPSWKKSYRFMKRVGYVPGEIDFPDVGTGDDFLKLQADFLGIKDKDYINELIDIFKIDVSAGLKRMSKGMKQKTALVAAFMGKPDVMILDEPSTGLDPLMRDNLIELILREKQRGCTFLISSHIFKELDDTCDRVAFINNGRFLREVKKAEFEKNDGKRYRIGFESDMEMNSFLEKNPFEVISVNQKYSHLVVSLDSDKEADSNSLIRLLADYRVRYVRYVPYTLENYYNEHIVKLEDKNIESVA